MTPDLSPATTNDSAAVLLRRIGWRTLPLLLLLYFIAYLDRVNIGFAANRMQHDLGFSDALYGTGAGFFFLGYLVAQVPSNLLLYRLGARRTIAGLMLVWGSVAAGMAFVHTPTMFLVLRFLLGIAEAGFYPGVILYLTLWLPRRVRTSFTAWFVFAIPLASILGGPVSSWILEHGRVGRFADWQVLLLGEAMPAVVMGVLLPWLMTDSPSEARWLSDEDRSLLAATRAADEPAVVVSETNVRNYDIGFFAHVLRFAAIYFTIQVALYSQSFWLPKILQSLGVAQKQVGWDIAVVYILTAIGMLVWGRISDRAPTRRWTLSVPLLFGAVGYAITAVPINNMGRLGIVLMIAAFGLGAAGGLGATSTFWAQVTLGQRASAIAGMLAMINALGNLGGFVGPTVLGYLQERTGSHAVGMLTASAFLLVGVALFYSVRSTIDAQTA
ncbi:MAG TPA: MFS transporter [Acidobacteriaceae bacterium]|jgi:MFS family permease